MYAYVCMNIYNWFGQKFVRVSRKMLRNERTFCQPNMSTWVYTCIYVNVQVHTYAYVSVSCVCPYLCIPSPTKATCFFLKTKWAFHPLVSFFTWKTLLLYHSPSMETHYSWASNLIIPCGRAIFTYLIFMLYVGSWKLWTWFLPSYLLQCLIIGSCSKTIFAIWMSEFCPYHLKCLISFIISAWKQVCLIQHSHRCLEASAL